MIWCWDSWVSVPKLLLVSMTLGKSLNLSGLSFPISEKGGEGGVSGRKEKKGNGLS